MGRCLMEIKCYCRMQVVFLIRKATYITFENGSPFSMSSISCTAVMAPATAPTPTPRSRPVSVVCPFRAPLITPMIAPPTNKTQYHNQEILTINSQTLHELKQKKVIFLETDFVCTSGEFHRTRSGHCGEG